MTRPLSGKIALVAGSTRGAGRGIAIALGEAGATVYCTGRSSKAHPGARPETIEETAALVDAAGGRGVPVRTDHADPAQVEALAAQVRAEHGGLDVVVDDVWGGEALVEFGVPVWEISLEKSKKMLDNAVWTHIITARHLTPLLLDRPGALWVEVTDGDHFGYRGTFVYDLVKMTVIRLAFGLSRELRPHGVTAVAVTPGFLRSEEMLAHFGVTEGNWRDGVAVDPNFIASESPRFVGRAIAALAADPERGRKSGRVLSSWDLGRAYDLRDLDGSRPDWGAHFSRTYPSPWRAAGDADYAGWESGPLEWMGLSTP